MSPSPNAKPVEQVYLTIPEDKTWNMILEFSRERHIEYGQGSGGKE
jgi:hypothetical protein